MKSLRTLLFLGTILVFASCDKIDDPFPSNVGQSIDYQGTEYIIDQTFGVGNPNELLSFLNNHQWISKTAPDNSAQRFVLLEEFTGHRCTFCPNGTKEILRLDNKFGDTLVPVGIHAGNFAIPDPAGSKFFTDFRVPNEDGEEYLKVFNVSGYPSGLVSRAKANASGPTTWENDIKTNKNKAAIATLAMTNYSSPTSNAIRSNLSITWNRNLSSEFNLQVFLVEDNIVDWQLDNGSEEEFYNHRHVLRKVVNSRFGKELEAVVKDETIDFEYIFSYEADWNVNNLDVVAFLFNRDASSYEVIQVNAAHVK